MKLSDIIDKIKKKKQPSLTGVKKEPSILSIFRKKQRLSKISMRDIDLLEGKNVKDLLKKYPLSSSQTKALDRLVSDYKKGNVSLSGSTTSKTKKKKLDKDKLEKIIKEYEEARQKKRNSLSLRIIDKFKELDVTELKKKFSLTNSKGIVYDKMMEDYKKGRMSFSQWSNKSKFDPRTISKGRISKLLSAYQAKDKKINAYFSPSKSKHSKIGPLNSLVDLKKINPSKISVSNLKKLFK